VATCNTVGQTAGYFVGNVVFLTLESADFCNKYIFSEHETHGLVTLSGSLCDIDIILLQKVSGATVTVVNLVIACTFTYVH